MDFQKHLRAYKEEKGMSDAKLAEMVGVARTTVSGWLNANNRSPNPEQISLIARALNITEQQLLNPDRMPIQNSNNTISIPIIEALAGCGSAGMLEQLRLSGDKMVIDKKVFPTDMISDKLSMIRIVGDSMQPYLDENDWAVIQMRNGYDIVPVNAIYLIAHGDNVQIKRCAFQPDGSCLLISDNHNYPPEKALAGDWDIVGKVVARLKVGSPMLIKK